MKAYAIVKRQPDKVEDQIWIETYRTKTAAKKALSKSLKLSRLSPGVKVMKANSLWDHFGDISHQIIHLNGPLSWFYGIGIAQIELPDDYPGFWLK